jgi:hypothetical protein
MDQVAWRRRSGRGSPDYGDTWIEVAHREIMKLPAYAVTAEC